MCSAGAIYVRWSGCALRAPSEGAIYLRHVCRSSQSPAGRRLGLQIFGRAEEEHGVGVGGAAGGVQSRGAVQLPTRLGPGATGRRCRVHAPDQPVREQLRQPLAQPPVLLAVPRRQTVGTGACEWTWSPERLPPGSLRAQEAWAGKQSVQTVSQPFSPSDCFPVGWETVEQTVLSAKDGCDQTRLWTNRHMILLSKQNVCTGGI